MGIISQVLDILHKNGVPFCDEAYEEKDDNSLNNSAVKKSD